MRSDLVASIGRHFMHSKVVVVTTLSGVEEDTCFIGVLKEAMPEFIRLELSSTPPDKGTAIIQGDHIIAIRHHFS